MTVGIQDGYRELVATADRWCADRFGDRLAATYLAGSVAVGEAWPGASDLDCFVFLRGEPTAADKVWRRRAEKRLEARFSICPNVHLTTSGVERLEQEAFWRFILRYNATRIRGVNLIAELGRRGIRTTRPSRKLARGRLPFVKACLDAAMAGQRVPSLGKLPSDPFLATRKLARDFVIVEGAYVLMARGAFVSFKQEDVLKGLRRVSRRWAGLVRTAEEILRDPHKAGVRPEVFLDMAEPFVNWAIERIDKPVA